MAYSPLINRTLMSTIAQVKDQVNRIWYASFQTDLADTLAAHLRRHALAGVQAALEMALVEELEVHRQPYRQHVLPEALQRSGSYTRRVLTTHGFIPDLHVPKLRGDNRARTWQVLTRYQLSMPLLLDQALYLYTLGLSIRDLQEALYVLFGHVLSREAVNRVTRAAQSPMDTWRTQPITDTPPILIVDGVWGQVLAPTGATFLDLTLIDSVTGEPLTYEAARRQRRQQLSTDAHAIFEAPTRAEADARLAVFRATWGGLEADVMRLLTKDIDACLTFYQFDQPLHRLVRSTNLLERFFREFRTKSDEIGAFPNDMSCLVVFHLIVIRDDAKHDRRHTAKTG